MQNIGGKKVPGIRYEGFDHRKTSKGFGVDNIPMAKSLNPDLWRF
jgi:hypothetical protein